MGLFADLSGFTPLSRRLGEEGAAGAERLSAILDRIFGQLIELIGEHGGDVVRLAGDAALAIFPADEGGLGVAALRAASCALAAQRALDGRTEEDATLRLKIGVDAGGIVAHDLAGDGGRREIVFAGGALQGAAHAEAAARAGEVLCGPGVVRLLDETARFGTERGDVRRLLELSATRTGTPLDPVDDATASPSLPLALRNRLEAGQQEWLAEFRPISTLFVGIGGIDWAERDAGDRGRALLTAIQRGIAPFGGALDKVLEDDKGTVAVVVFGLPDHTHEDDAARASLAALATHEQLTAAGFQPSIGVSTGRAFCGAYGSRQRREYTVLGDSVNRSARLMSVAAGTVLCDAATAERARRRVGFEELPPVQLKGLRRPVPVHRPTGREQAAEARPMGRFLGRDTERERLRAWVRGGRGIAWIAGEAGIGKSTLAAWLVSTVDGVVLDGGGDPTNQSTLGHAWRPVLEGLLGDAPLDRAQTLLADRPELLAWVPLLEDIVPIESPPSELTAQMDGQARADARTEVVMALLRAAPPALLLLEDAHWFDSGSWALLLAALRSDLDVPLLVTTRPIAAPVPTEYAVLTDQAAEHITLSSLPDEEIAALAARTLGVATLPASASELITRRAEGHPLYAEELAHALCESGVVEITDGQAHLTSAGALEQTGLPETIEGVISSRIDRLSAAEQLAMKVASVIGRVFALRLLKDIHPLPDDRDHLRDHVRSLERHELALPEAPEPAPSWLFKHALVQETAYGLMIPSQRSKLHAAVARWLTRHEEQPSWSLLAWHWGRAGDNTQAMEAAAQAGEEALVQFANAEALAFFTEALGRGPTVDPVRRARWHFGAAEALRRLGRWEELEQQAAAALALLGHPLPRSTFGTLLSLLKEMGTQILHRMLPRLFPTREGQAAEVHRLVGAVQQRLGEHYYRQNSALPMLRVIWTQANHADRGGGSEASAYAYASLGAILALLGMTGLRGHYHDRARAVAAATGRDGVVAYTNTLILSDGAATGDLAWVDEPFAIAEALYPRLGDSFNRELTLSLRGYSRMHMGRFDDARSAIDALWESSHPWGADQNQALALSARLGMTLAEGPPTADQLEQLTGFLERIPHVDQVLATGLLAAGWKELGELPRALALAEQCAALMRDQAPTIYYCMLGAWSFTTLYLDLLEEHPDDARADDWRQSVGLGLSMMGSLSQMNAVCRPRTQVLQARWARLRGKASAAERRLAKAEALAEQVNGDWDRRLIDAERARLAAR